MTTTIITMRAAAKLGSTTMTERRPPRVSTLELRLYAVTLFAAVYAIAWRAIAADAPSPSPPPVATPAPAVVPPAGWQLATTSRPAPTLTPSPRPSVPRIRVRTRSS